MRTIFFPICFDKFFQGKSLERDLVGVFDHHEKHSEHHMDHAQIY